VGRWIDNQCIHHVVLQAGSTALCGCFYSHRRVGGHAPYQRARGLCGTWIGVDDQNMWYHGYYLDLSAAEPCC
jgi:hypothetical protein